MSLSCRILYKTSKRKGTRELGSTEMSNYRIGHINYVLPEGKVARLCLRSQHRKRCDADKTNSSDCLCESSSGDSSTHTRIQTPYPSFPSPFGNFAAGSSRAWYIIECTAPALSFSLCLEIWNMQGTAFALHSFMRKQSIWPSAFFPLNCRQFT